MFMPGGRGFNKKMPVRSPVLLFSCWAAGVGVRIHACMHAWRGGGKGAKYVDESRRRRWYVGLFLQIKGCVWRWYEMGENGGEDVR